MSVTRVEDWMKGVKLEVASEKTELLTFSGKRKIGQLTVKVAGTDVSAKRSLRYLGVTLDKNLSFREHLQERRGKAQQVAAALSRIMPNVKGPGTSKRKILAAVAASPILYAAKTWVGALTIQANKNELTRAERPAVIRVARCYRTTSTEAARVIAGVVPLHIQAQVRALRIRPRAERRHRELTAWQNEWTRGNRATWTRTLIPDLRIWVERKHGELNHQLAQALTGHGCFAHYLQRIGKRTNDQCLTCGETENAEHVLFTCSRWSNIRPVFMDRPEDLVTQMTESTENWEAVEKFATAAIGTLEQEDRNITPAT